MIRLTEENEEALRKDIRRHLSLGNTDSDAAYIEDQHVDLDTYRAVWRSENAKFRAEQSAAKTADAPST